MGYHTEFSGDFVIDKQLSDAHKAFLRKFSSTRRVKRNAVVANSLPDPIRIAANLPIGKEGGFYVGATGFAGQDRDKSVIDYNNPPVEQPGLWCQWTPNNSGTTIEWDGGEKFYYYVEWLNYLINNFLSPWGYTINGKVSWEGERHSDTGIIIVVNNLVTTARR